MLLEEYLKLLQKQKTQWDAQRVLRDVPDKRGEIRLDNEQPTNNVKIIVGCAANRNAVRAVLKVSLGKERVDRFGTILTENDV